MSLIVPDILAFPVLLATLLFPDVDQCLFRTCPGGNRAYFATQITTVITLKLFNHICHCDL